MNQFKRWRVFLLLFHSGKFLVRNRPVTPVLLAILWTVLGSCQSAPENKPIKIGFSQCTGGDQWRQTMLNDMKRELTFHANYTLLYEDAENSTTRQISQIQALVEQGIELLIVSPNETAPFKKIVETVFAKGIPVILLDRKIDTESYNAYIGGDNTEIGRLVGSFVGLYLKGRGNVVEIWGLPGSSPAQERHRGFLEELRKYPGVKIVKELNGQWEKDTARQVVTANLAAIKNADLLFAHNDVMALGAYEVFKKNGLQNQLAFAGIDALPGPKGGMQLVTDGILKATFLYPTGGEEAIETAVKILEGKAVNRETILNSIQINAANVRAIKAQSDKLLAQQADIERQSQRMSELTQTYTSQKNTLYLTLASLLIALLLSAYALYLYRSKQTAYQTLEKQNEEIRQQKDKIETVSQQARLATEEKLRFYSYISHEFNTPLSLILTPTEELLDKKTVGPHELRTRLSLVQKNAYRLLRLVDQMLDLRKTDAGKQRLHASEQDVVAFVREVVQDFRGKAQKQRIDLQLVTALTAQPLWFDAEKLDKVLFNLLSNAFKYTPKGGFIHVHLDRLEPQIRLQVRDNGEGMTPDEQAHAFDLFFSGTKPYNLGKGLGLALSMEFIQLHRGDIRVTSEPGRGTLFTVLLPLGSDHLEADEMTSTASRRTLNPSTIEVDSEEELAGAPPLAVPTRRAGTVLIIEDNDDLRTFLTTCLGPEFDLIAEAEAEKGWEQALEAIPDLIISDIMLPGVDGLQLTQRIKADLRTSHIPVVLLTAKGQMEQRIEGTRAGADVYIAKPFNTTYLLETVRTTLENRRKWQRRYASDFLVASASSGPDKKFLNQLTALIEQNLTDAGFGVEKLSRDMGLSRVQLYRKVQALLDVNVVDYITEIRLKKAKHLLIETNKPMSEIAYETGFNSPAYFTTFFKQHTRKTPSDYRKSPSQA